MTKQRPPGRRPLTCPASPITKTRQTSSPLRLRHLCLRRLPRLLRLLLQPQRGDLVGAGAVEGLGFEFDAEDDVLEAAAGGDDGVVAGGGGGLVDDGLALGGDERLVGGLGGFAAVGGVVGLVVGHGAEGMVGRDVLAGLGGGDFGVRVDVAHDFSSGLLTMAGTLPFACYSRKIGSARLCHGATRIGQTGGLGRMRGDGLRP